MNIISRENKCEGTGHLLQSVYFPRGTVLLAFSYHHGYRRQTGLSKLRVQCNIHGSHDLFFWNMLNLTSFLVTHAPGSAHS